MAQLLVMPPVPRPAWIEVDLDAIAHNARIIRQHVGAGRRMMAVVKANAYGHGAVAVAGRLESEGVELFGVATASEGLELKEAGIRQPIVVLGAAHPLEIPAMTAADLIPTVYSGRFLDTLLAVRGPGGAPPPFHLKVDTGMGRLGLLPEEIPGALSRIVSSGHGGALVGLFTTLSCADDPHDPHTAMQLSRFQMILEQIRAAGLCPVDVHAANSGGVIDHPPSWLGTVRPGIMLYGIHPSGMSTRMGLRSAMEVKARLALVKRVPAGTPIGYGRSFVSSRPSVIGTVGVGYADGLPRAIAQNGHALVRGARAPYTGRISMDHAMIDLTAITQAAEGDEVVLLGEQGSARVTAEDLAAWSGTIAYEIVARFGPRLARRTKTG